MELRVSNLYKIEKMITLLDLSEDFTLAFVRCSEPTICDAINKEVFNRVSDRIFVYYLIMDEKSSDLIQLLRDAVQSEKYKLKKNENKKISFFVFGLDKAIKKRSNDGKSKALLLLNMKRDELLEIKHSIIIWIDVVSLSSILSEAMDFFSWRTTVYNFDDMKENFVKPTHDSEENYSEAYQQIIHHLCLSDDSHKRINGLDKLSESFIHLPDILLAWNDLNRLINDTNSSVRARAASTLGSVFSEVPDKQQAMNGIHSLTKDYDDDVRFKTTCTIGSVFSLVPDKHLVWNDLTILTNDTNSSVKAMAISVLASVFSEVPDKQQAWNSLCSLINDANSTVRARVAFALGSVFSEVPNKLHAWNGLHKLINDVHSSVRVKAASTLGSVFSEVPDKQLAWDDLIKLTTDEDEDVRSKAASALGSSFSNVPDKQKAWNDIHKLTADTDIDVRYEAVSAIIFAFLNVPDKQEAWKDLIKLSTDENEDVRSKAVTSLGSLFSDVPDKQKAWNDLHNLINNKSDDVRYEATSSIGFAYSHVPDKQQAWNDLIKLTTDKNKNVKAIANHSLGKISILKASQANKEEDYKRDLEEAINFFEKASQESSVERLNPSQFCLPFYRSFHTIIFKKRESIEEVDKYLEEAKDAIQGSKSKELLFEAVENLAEALKEAQNLENMDLQTMKSELNFYRTYYDRATEFMKDTEETAPYATATMRKGLPILDRNLKGILKEIKDKSKMACKQLRGTPQIELATTINREIQKWEISDPREMAQYIEDIALILKNKIIDIPKNKYILNEIELMRREKNISKKFEILLYVISPLLSSQERETQVKNVNDKEIDNLTIYLKPGINGSLIISNESKIGDTYSNVLTTIPLVNISYPEISEDLDKIKERRVDKLYKLPTKLANKIKDHLLQNNAGEILEKLI